MDSSKDKPELTPVCVYKHGFMMSPDRRIVGKGLSVSLIGFYCDLTLNRQA